MTTKVLAYVSEKSEVRISTPFRSAYTLELLAVRRNGVCLTRDAENGIDYPEVITW